MLGTSYENVRKLQRTGKLHSDPDRHGVHRFDRREVEDLARKRGLQIKPSGELAAHVFALFKARRSFEDIVIETQQEPSVIRELRKEYEAGFTTSMDAPATREERERRAHEEAMLEIDAEFARRRRAE